MQFFLYATGKYFSGIYAFSMEVGSQGTAKLFLLFFFAGELLQPFIRRRDFRQLSAAVFQIIGKLIRRTSVFSFETGNIMQALLDPIVFFRREIQGILKITQQFIRVRQQESSLFQFVLRVRQLGCKFGRMPAMPGRILRA